MMMVVAFWSLILSIFFYSGLAIWRLAISRRVEQSSFLALAFIGMALWAVSLLSKETALIVFVGAFRNLGWLIYIYAMIRSVDRNAGARHWSTSYLVGLCGLILLRAVARGFVLFAGANTPLGDIAMLLALCAGLIFSITALIFAHNLYRATATGATSGFRLILVAVGILWAYDINLFTMALLGYGDLIRLSEGRGILMLLLAPAFAIAARRKEHWRITLSRRATTQSLLLVAIGSYFVVISAATRAITWFGGGSGQFFKLAAVVALAGGGVVLLFSPRTRAMIKIIAVKHLFEHRYDYRSEWLRFSATIGGSDGPAISTEERVIRSVADVTESLSGLLLLVDREGRFESAGVWDWKSPLPFEFPFPVDPAWTRSLEETGRIVTFDDLRSTNGYGEGEAPPPDWLLATTEAWAAVPLLRSQRLVGIVVLGRPRLSRLLDWEDFDLLKVIGQQVAMYLADVQNQAELEEARRFEEFNRRFAFIIHDIKNVVSQLSLVSANAAVHGANPKFQASMADTLANATDKMTILLSRLSAERTIAEIAFEKIDLAAMLGSIAQERLGQHPISVAAAEPVTLLGDEDKLRLALDHLIQNAIEASPAEEPIILSLEVSGGAALITVADKGVGMSAAFVRNILFKPFVSTKNGGFGIGAAECKALVKAMGGTLDVATAEGRGSRFTIRLPLRAQQKDEVGGA